MAPDYCFNVNNEMWVI